MYICIYRPQSNLTLKLSPEAKPYILKCVLLSKHGFLLSLDARIYASTSSTNVSVTA